MKDLTDTFLYAAVVTNEFFSLKLIVVNKTVAVGIGYFGHTFIVINGVHGASGVIFLD